jgi:hypothetical protein
VQYRNLMRYEPTPSEHFCGRNSWMMKCVNCWSRVSRVWSPTHAINERTLDVLESDEWYQSVFDLLAPSFVSERDCIMERTPCSLPSLFGDHLNH